MMYKIEHYYPDGSLRDSVEFKTIKATQQWVGEMLLHIRQNETEMSMRISMKEVNDEKSK